MAGVALLSTAGGVAGAYSVFGGGWSSSSAAVAASAQVSATDARTAEDYWTPARMASATPIDERAAAGFELQRVKLTAKQFVGIPSVGALFFNNGQGNHYCTASVVTSAKRNLLLTAAHCINGKNGYAKNIAFVPKYNKGSRPYGIWSAKMMLVDKRWATRKDPDLDFGFVALNNRNGRRIADVVGANKLAVNKGAGRMVNVTGYPMIAYARSDRPIYCRAKTKKHSKYQIQFDCNGFYGGTSGSPWLLNYSTSTHTGYINGVIGGFQGGGNHHYTSYSPYFDKDVNTLRAAANRKA